MEQSVITIKVLWTLILLYSFVGETLGIIMAIESNPNDSDLMKITTIGFDDDGDRI